MEIRPASQIHGTIEMPPSADLFALSGLMALSARAEVRIAPVPDTPLVKEWTEILAPHCTIRREEQTMVLAPAAGEVPASIALPADAPYRDFAVFFLLGLGKTVSFRSLSPARIEAWKNLAARFGCVLEAQAQSEGTSLAISSAQAFAVPRDVLSFDDLYALLGLACGLGRQCAVTVDYAFSSVLRHLLPAFGCALAVKSNLNDKRDTVERRIRLLQKKKKTDESQSFSISADFSKRPESPVAISLPGDEILTALMVVAKSIVQKGNLVIGNVSLEPWNLITLDFIRKMGCRPGLQETGQCTFGATGMLQLQQFTLSNRTTTCKPACHYAPHLAPMAVIAAFGQGQSVFRGLEDLRLDMPDRLEQVLSCVKQLGARFGDMPDGLVIEGSKQFDGFDISESLPAPVSGAFAVAGCKCIGATRVSSEQIERRWPDFLEKLASICEFR
jgi:hypothetical protein